MNAKSIIEIYKKSVIQIATPYSTGTGFYLSEFDLIVTNEHVIRDNKEVIIDGEGYQSNNLGLSCSLGDARTTRHVVSCNIFCI